jgi:hypothetical protein
MLCEDYLVGQDGPSFAYAHVTLTPITEIQPPISESERNWEVLQSVAMLTGVPSELVRMFTRGDYATFKFSREAEAGTPQDNSDAETETAENQPNIDQSNGQVLESQQEDPASESGAVVSGVADAQDPAVEGHNSTENTDVRGDTDMLAGQNMGEASTQTSTDVQEDADRTQTHLGLDTNGGGGGDSSLVPNADSESNVDTDTNTHNADALQQSDANSVAPKADIHGAQGSVVSVDVVHESESEHVDNNTDRSCDVDVNLHSEAIHTDTAETVEDGSGVHHGQKDGDVALEGKDVVVVGESKDVDVGTGDVKADHIDSDSGQNRGLLEKNNGGVTDEMKGTDSSAVEATGDDDGVGASLNDDAVVSNNVVMTQGKDFGHAQDDDDGCVDARASNNVITVQERDFGHGQDDDDGCVDAAESETASNNVITIHGGHFGQGEDGAQGEGGTVVTTTASNNHAINQEAMDTGEGSVPATGADDHVAKHDDVITREGHDSGSTANNITGDDAHVQHAKTDEERHTGDVARAEGVKTNTKHTSKESKDSELEDGSRPRRRRSSNGGDVGRRSGKRDSKSDVRGDIQDNSDGHSDNSDGHSDNSDGHSDNSDGHSDNSDGHSKDDMHAHEEFSTESARTSDEGDETHTDARQTSSWDSQDQSSYSDSDGDGDEEGSRYTDDTRSTDADSECYDAYDDTMNDYEGGTGSYYDDAYDTQRTNTGDTHTHSASNRDGGTTTEGGGTDLDRGSSAYSNNNCSSTSADVPNKKKHRQTDSSDSSRPHTQKGVHRHHGNHGRNTSASRDSDSERVQSASHTSDPNRRNSRQKHAQRKQHKTQTQTPSTADSNSQRRSRRERDRSPRRHKSSSGDVTAQTSDPHGGGGSRGGDDKDRKRSPSSSQKKSARKGKKVKKRAKHDEEESESRESDMGPRQYARIVMHEANNGTSVLRDGGLVNCAGIPQLNWREVRLYVASSVADVHMQAERRALVRFVLPALRSVCRRRRIRFQWVLCHRKPETVMQMASQVCVHVCIYVCVKSVCMYVCMYEECFRGLCCVVCVEESWG